jgi:Na+-translocating ferredoxin:NAD+ oxidoreductase RnfE subunit
MKNLKITKRNALYLVLAAALLVSCSSNETVSAIDAWLSQSIETMKIWHLIMIVGIVNLITGK